MASLPPTETWPPCCCKGSKRPSTTVGFHTQGHSNSISHSPSTQRQIVTRGVSKRLFSHNWGCSMCAPLGVPEGGSQQHPCRRPPLYSCWMVSQGKRACTAAVLLRWGASPCIWPHRRPFPLPDGVSGVLKVPVIGLGLGFGLSHWLKWNYNWIQVALLPLCVKCGSPKDLGLES